MITPKERPILMSAPMVRATLRDVNPKTQTRRVMKPQPTWREAPCNDIACWYPSGHDDGKSLCYASKNHFMRGIAADFCPYGQPGDRLWVRETWRIDPTPGEDGVCPTIYRADMVGTPCSAVRRAAIRWRPSIHMPRWASRITLEITGVRVERLQDICEEDAIAEGVEFVAEPDLWRNYARTGFDTTHSARDSYRSLWDTIHTPNYERNPSPYCWNANPWVWVVDFRRIDQAKESPHAS